MYKCVNKFLTCKQIIQLKPILFKVCLILSRETGLTKYMLIPHYLHFEIFSSKACAVHAIIGILGISYLDIIEVSINEVSKPSRTGI